MTCAAPISAGSAETLARGLGWFSIALGALELAAPRTLADTLGMKDREHLIAGYGAREIATGVGILAASDPAPWIWARVGGDVLDFGTLAAGLSTENPRRGSVFVALATVMTVAGLDVFCAQSLAMNRRVAGQRPRQDYSRRSGWPQPPAAMRGAARDFDVPRDMRTPDALRPYPPN
ncbi:MAG: cyclase dehydrase [Alphaproteobacteria bacterium]|nr:cyclase dehydrase [Alphaproteobacteria bacterium]